MPHEPKPVAKRRRLPRDERERLIVDEAIRFFAEVGFEGQTRALAQRLGVTQPLLYRYFPDKGALIERVYKEVFEGGWETEWEGWLADRSRPLIERLKALYTAYARINFTYERVRLLLYMGLKEKAIASRYLAFLQDRFFVPLILELRAQAGMPADLAPDEREIEMVASLHGALNSMAVRRWVYETEETVNMEMAISAVIDVFIDGAAASCRQWADRRQEACQAQP